MKHTQTTQKDGSKKSNSAGHKVILVLCVQQLKNREMARFVLRFINWIKPGHQNYKIDIRPSSHLPCVE